MEPEIVTGHGPGKPAASRLRACGLSAVLMLGSAWVSGCALGQHLPPGTAGGHFWDEPARLSVYSRATRAQHDALDAAERERLTAHFIVLQDLVRSSQGLRDQMRRAKGRLHESYGRHKELPIDDRELLLESARSFIELDQTLYAMWTTYRRYLPYGSEPDPYAPERAVTLLRSNTRSLGGLIALTAEIVRLDNARTALDLLQEQIALVHFLNLGDAQRGIPPESYDRVLGSYRDPERRELLQRLLYAVDTASRQLHLWAIDDGRVSFCLALLEESLTARELRREGAIGRHVRFMGTVAERTFAGLLAPFLEPYLLAVVEEAPAQLGRPTRIVSSAEVVHQVVTKLQPLDVIYLQDRRRRAVVNGFTRAVVFLGEDRDQRRWGAVRHPAHALYERTFRRGKTFLEVTAFGPRLLELDEVLAAEEFAIVRYPMSDAPAHLHRALDVLTSPGFLSPPRYHTDEHAARLLMAVHDIPLEPAAPTAPPPLRSLAEVAIQRDFDGQIVLCSRDGRLVPEAQLESGMRLLLNLAPEEE